MKQSSFMKTSNSYRRIDDQTAHIAHFSVLVHDSAIIFAPLWSLTQISSITRANAVGHSTIQLAFSDCPACPLGPKCRLAALLRAPPPSINDVTCGGGGTKDGRRARERQIEEKSPFHSSQHMISSISLDSLFAPIDNDLEAGETQRQTGI